MKSIRARLLAWLLSLTLLGGAAMGAVTYRSVLRETESLFDYQLRQMALSLKDQGVITPDERAALVDDDREFVVQIWSIDGDRIYASHPDFALPRRAILGFSEVVVEDGLWRLFSTATRDRVIQVAQPQSIRRRLAAQAALRTVNPVLLLTPLLAAAVVWSIGTSLRPVRRLAFEVSRRDAESLMDIQATGLPTEVLPLVDSFNSLLGRLRGAFDSQRAFVSDAAHELRSPLTALKLQIQLLRRAPDEAARETAVRSLAAGIERAAHLVSQLLALARAEPGARHEAPEPCDLAEVARLAVSDVVLLAEAKSIRIGMKAEGEVRVLGDPEALRVMVRNLVDNAVRYTPFGGMVELSVRIQGERIDLAVDDSGPGIPVSERERVFARFFRRAASDGDGDHEVGSGLGLAIVRNIAQRHSASVRLADSPYGGLTAAVTFRPWRAAG